MLDLDPNIAPLLEKIRTTVSRLNPDHQRLLQQHASPRLQSQHPKALENLRLTLRKEGLPLSTTTLARCLPHCMPSPRRPLIPTLVAALAGMALAGMVKMEPTPTITAIPLSVLYPNLEDQIITPPEIPFEMLPDIPQEKSLARAPAKSVVPLASR